ncbi:hypothetical protein ACLB2K_024360 [Fragaria x ananassa]
MNHSSGADSRRRKTTSYRRQAHRSPSSPLQHWKLDDNKATGGSEATARKLAAGLWQLRFSEISRRKELNSGSDDHSRAHLELESSLTCPKLGLERATKWDHCCSNESDDIHGLYVKDCRVNTVSVVSSLSDELIQARLCIRELEVKQKSLRKKVKHFLRKFEEERVSWKHGDRDRDGAVIKDLMRELSRERRSRQQMENLGTNLISRLAKAKLSADHFMKTYEEEKKNRRTMEQVCSELAEYIRENKAERKALKRESMKVVDELDEERKMLQMAEAWREERVQMKLIDAKLALEDKYHQVNKLITDIETFLRSRFTTLDMPDLRKAELILQEVKSLNIQDLEEFCNVSLKSDDIISTFEAFQPYEGTRREIKPFICHSTSSDGSELHPVSPDNNRFNINPLPSYSNGLNGYSSGVQVSARGWANGSHGEDQGSSHCLRWRNSSIVRDRECRHGSRNVGECKDSAGQSSPDTEIIEVCSVLEQQSEQKPPSMSELWRSCPDNGEVFKILLDEDKRRLSSGVTSCLRRNADSRLTEHETRHRNSNELLLPPGIANPHITRGMQGRIQWPRAGQKNSSNAKVLEAKIESQRSQLRHVFKQRFM